MAELESSNLVHKPYGTQCFVQEQSEGNLALSAHEAMPGLGSVCCVEHDSQRLTQCS